MERRKLREISKASRSETSTSTQNRRKGDYEQKKGGGRETERECTIGRVVGGLTKVMCQTFAARWGEFLSIRNLDYIREADGSERPCPGEGARRKRGEWYGACQKRARLGG